jgi:hypothetical protein
MKENCFPNTLFIAMLICIGLMTTRCEKNTSNFPLTYSDTASFIGTFRSIDDTIQKGTVSVLLFKDSYECDTGLPYGHGAGKLKITVATIDFADTLFFVIPAIYGPSYVLSGKHYYSFDGENLRIWKDRSISKIEYDLKLVK